ncbi:IPT/TIG domain-containing protein [Hymenobacter guriensis]|uniref:T9SS type A sorting domain-containing protein n=1 Tax=Hymenobacter guriensis TaxID=2793065 RepID=A0ABS0L5C1_9BACT|nr:IPT/TIG domain-containing protein [Hymenobacter guriensis]MBG8555322.1 T9SS type A sorting domain-containing protein [Hymenobacter guriensis]
MRTFTRLCSTRWVGLLFFLLLPGLVAAHPGEGVAPGVHRVAPPTISSFTPSSGAARTTVEVTGTNLNNISGIAINGVANTAPFITDGTGNYVSFSVPNGATTGRITITTSGGTATSATDFVVEASGVPAISNLAPTSGPVGTQFIITGTNLASVDQVLFGGEISASFTHDSPTQITATVPASIVPGTYDVTISGPNGSDTVFSGFTITNASHSVTSVNPASGSVGTNISIFGTGFVGSTAVYFNGVSANFSVESDEGITAQVPTGATTGPITITTPSGTATSPGNFTVTVKTPPTVSNVSPASGPVGTQIIITGTNLNTIQQVLFIPGTGAAFTINSSTQITATVPASLSTGNKSLILSGTQGFVNVPGGFTVTAATTPSISNFSPQSGPAQSNVTLFGAGFTNATAVQFNGVDANFFNVISDSEIFTSVPEGTSSGPITVTTPNGTATSSINFTVVGNPVVYSLSPEEGPVGTTVVITGENFTAGSFVTFGDAVVASRVVNSSTKITATVPAGATTGPVGVNTGGTTGFSPGVFTVTASPAPTFTFFSSGNSGPLLGRISLTGTNLKGATLITFSGTSNNTVAGPFTTTADGTTISNVQVPLGAISGPVTITTPGGTSNSQTYTVIRDLVISGPGTYGVDEGTYRTVTIRNGGTGMILGNGTTIEQSFTVENGGRMELYIGENTPIVGPGTFEVQAGGILEIYYDGIYKTGAKGVIQTATRIFSTDAIYEFENIADVSTFTGTGLPSTVRSLIISSGRKVILTQPVSIRRELRLNSGALDLRDNRLTLLSDATGTALIVNNGGTIENNGQTLEIQLTVQRYIDPSRNAGLGYRHLSAPVSNATVADFGSGGTTPKVNEEYNTSPTPGKETPFPTVFGYDQSRLASATNDLAAFSKGWVSPASLEEALPVGRGFSVNTPAAQTLKFTGTPNEGTKTLTLVRNAGPTADDAGWHLVGNPYPSPLDWSKVAAADRSNLDAAMYVFESTSRYGGEYRTYANGVGGNPLIGLGQGFFVRVTKGQTSGSLTFRNTQRVTSYATQAPVRRGSDDTRPLVKLTLGTEQSTSQDALYLYAEAGATAGLDAGFDAAKLRNTSGLNLAALTQAGEELAIQGLPALTGNVRIPLLLQVPAAGTYLVRAPQLANLPAGTTIFLEDATTNQRMDLQAANASYSFQADKAQTLNGRFWLNLSSSSPLATRGGALANALAVYPNPARTQTTVLLPAGSKAATLTLHDALGRVVRTTTMPAGGGAATVLLQGLSAGVYQLQVQAGTEQATRRLVVE